MNNITILSIIQVVFVRFFDFVRIMYSKAGKFDILFTNSFNLIFNIPNNEEK